MNFEGKCELRNGLIVNVVTSTFFPDKYMTVTPGGWCTFWDKEGNHWKDREFDIIGVFTNTIGEKAIELSETCRINLR